MRRQGPIRNTNRPLGRERAGSQHLLDVRVRRSTVKRQRSRRIVGAVLGLVLWSGLIAAAWFGFHAVTEKFFFANPEYALRHLRVETQELFTEDEISEITGIRKGTNIFQIDLAAAESSLRAIDQVATVRITRDWPDRISIEVTKRNPIAWIADRDDADFSSESAVFVDRHSRIMRPFRIEPSFWQLPVIYCPDLKLLEQGDILAKADLRAALDLLAEYLKRPESLLKIRSLDIRKGYAITVKAQDGSMILFSPDDPVAQLEKLEPLLKHSHETGRAIEFANLIPGRYTPVRFQLVSAPDPTKKLQPKKE